MEASLSEIWDRLKTGKNYRRLLGRSDGLQVLYEVREKLGPNNKYTEPLLYNMLCSNSYVIAESA